MELQENEEIVKTVRFHPMTYSLQLLAGILLIVVPFFFISPLWRMGHWGQVIFWVPAGLGLIYILRTFVNWRGNTLIITNHRLIIFRRKGIFHREIFKPDYQKIKDISVKIRGLFQTLFSCGTLRIYMGPGEGQAGTEVEFSNIHGPTRVQELIIRLQKDFHQSRSEESPGHLMEKARELRDKLGRDLFREIAEEEEKEK